MAWPGSKLAQSRGGGWKVLGTWPGRLCPRGGAWVPRPHSPPPRLQSLTAEPDRWGAGGGGLRSCPGPAVMGRFRGPSPVGPHTYAGADADPGGSSAPRSSRPLEGGARLRGPLNPPLQGCTSLLATVTSRHQLGLKSTHTGSLTALGSEVLGPRRGQGRPPTRGPREPHLPAFPASGGVASLGRGPSSLRPSLCPPPMRTLGPPAVQDSLPTLRSAQRYP